MVANPWKKKGCGGNMEEFLAGIRRERKKGKSGEETGTKVEISLRCSTYNKEIV